MSRALVGGLGLAAALLAGGLALLLLTPLPPSPPGPEPGRSLYRAHCASCHGAEGDGRAWRTRLLFLRPGDLTAPGMTTVPDTYLADLIRHGGATVGRPGMPAFGYLLSDADVQAVVAYVRTLPAAAGRKPPP